MSPPCEASGSAMRAPCAAGAIDHALGLARPSLSLNGLGKFLQRAGGCSRACGRGYAPRWHPGGAPSLSQDVSADRVEVAAAAQLAGRRASLSPRLARHARSAAAARSRWPAIRRCRRDACRARREHRSRTAARLIEVQPSAPHRRQAAAAAQLAGRRASLSPRLVPRSIRCRAARSRCR